jgi:hypothetical protein
MRKPQLGPGLLGGAALACLLACSEEAQPIAAPSGTSSTYVGAPCGAVPSGNAESRQCYGADSAPTPEACKATTQTRSCQNGVWTPDFAVCAHLACQVSGVIPPPAADYYASTTGDDGSGDGSFAHPWLSLAHAAATVKMAGKSIYVLPGTYTELEAVKLAPGVSVSGAGETSKIRVGYAMPDTNVRNSFLTLVSQAEGAMGNQSISGLAFDGISLKAPHAIHVEGRSNVKIHHCTFKDFGEDAVTFHGGVSTSDSGPPTTYATGNEFHHNTVANSSAYAGYGHGALQFGGQVGFLAYDNTMTQTQRAAGQNGYLIKLYRAGYNKGCKIYDNVLTKAPASGVPGDFDFAVEMWNVEGLEIYGNTIAGDVDVAGIRKGTYAFGVDIHHNKLGAASALPPNAHRESGITLEQQAWGGASDVIIRNNRFQHMSYAVYMYNMNAGVASNNIEVVNNLFFDTVATVFSGVPGSTISDYRFWHNTLYAGQNNLDGIEFDPFANMRGFSFRNNIVVGFKRAPFTIYAPGTPGSYEIANLSIENNLFFGCGNNNGVSNLNADPGMVQRNATVANNRVLDPAFVSTADHHIQSVSPARAAGLSLGVASDFDGVGRSTPPDIGAYQFR